MRKSDRPFFARLFVGRGTDAGQAIDFIQSRFLGGGANKYIVDVVADLERVDRPSQ